jgi:translation elongation factor EF-4
MFEYLFRLQSAPKILQEKRVKIRKDVLAKCYGGDITREKNFWKNKKRAKNVSASLEA